MEVPERWIKETVSGPESRQVRRRRISRDSYEQINKKYADQPRRARRRMGRQVARRVLGQMRLESRA